MNILIGTTLYCPGAGGKENYLWFLARGLSERGHRVRCFARFLDFGAYARGRLRFADPPRFTRTSPETGVTVSPLSVASPVRVLHRVLGPAILRPRFASLARWVARRTYGMPLAGSARWADVVHFDGIGFELIGFGFWAAARRAGRPFVVVPHLHAGSWGDGPSDLALYRRADLVIAKTVAEARHLAALGIERGRIQTVGNFPVLPAQADPESFRVQRRIAGPYVLFLGRRTREKGFDLFAQAAAIVRGGRPEVEFVAAGPTCEGDLGACPDDVRDIGFLSEWEKASALAGCVALCVPSPVEAFGMAYLEAWSFGRPVVAGPSSQVAEVVEDGVDGIVADATGGAVARAIEALLSDPGRASELGRRGRAKVERRYAPAGIIEETIAAYRRLVEDLRA